MKISQIFHHYKKWEDWKGGLYDSNCDRFDEKLNLSKEVLEDENLFLEVAKDMVSSWIYSSEQNLSDRSMNRQAWIGQASCCFNHGAPDYVTIQAWWMLTDEQRSKANSVADKVISEWEQEYVMKGSLWGN